MKTRKQKIILGNSVTRAVFGCTVRPSLARCPPGIALIVAKLLTEASLFLFSYWSQRKFVY